MADVRQDATSTAAKNRSVSVGERFDAVVEQAVVDGTLKAWRKAIAHDKKGDMPAAQWTKVRENDEQEAMQMLEELSRTYPQASFVKTMMGQVKHHFGKDDEAARFYEEALAANRNDPLLTFKLAEARRASGEIKKAEAFYRDVLLMQPDFTPASLGLARCLLKGDRASLEAREIVARVLEKDPQNRDALELSQALFASKP